MKLPLFELHTGLIWFPGWLFLVAWNLVVLKNINTQKGYTSPILSTYTLWITTPIHVSGLFFQYFFMYTFFF